MVVKFLTWNYSWLVIPLSFLAIILYSFYNTTFLFLLVIFDLDHPVTLNLKCYLNQPIRTECRTWLVFLFMWMLSLNKRLCLCLLLWEHYYFMEHYLFVDFTWSVKPHNQFLIYWDCIYFGINCLVSLKMLFIRKPWHFKPAIIYDFTVIVLLHNTELFLFL